MGRSRRRLQPVSALALASTRGELFRRVAACGGAGGVRVAGEGAVCGLGGQTVCGTEAIYVAGASPRPRMARELASMAPVIQSGIVVHT